MKKFKKVLLGALSVLTFGLFAVTTKVNAQSYTNIGSAVITTTGTVSGNTKTWDFKQTTSKTLANGDDVNGVIVQAGYNKGAAGTPSIKSSNGGLSFFLHGYVYVPVMSASSSGTATVLLTSNSGGRYIDLIDNQGSVSTSILTANNTAMEYPFDSDDIWTVNEKYYIKLWSEVYTDNVASGDTNSSNSGEIKIGSVSVVLDSESYGTPETLYTVTYKDGSSTLKTDSNCAAGSKIDYFPKKYGYDFEGWYTESTLDNKINTSSYTVSDNVTLFANWTPWTNTGIEKYSLSASAVEKIATGFEKDVKLTNNFDLTPSIYTMMTNVAMTTTTVTLPGASSATQAACFSTNGEVKTTGYGLKFTAPSNGILTLWAGSGSSEERTIKVTDGTDDLTPTSGSVTVPSSYAPHEIVFDVNENTTYYVGGNKGVRIYYISFTPNAEIALGTSTGTSTVTNGNNAVRCYAAINLNTTEKIKNISVKVIGFDGEDNPLKTATAEGLTYYDTLNINGCNDTKTLYTYYSVYGLTSTYNGYKIKFEFTVTLSDDSTYTESLTYTVAF